MAKFLSVTIYNQARENFLWKRKVPNAHLSDKIIDRGVVIHVSWRNTCIIIKGRYEA
jgi:hypothetical protein